MYLLKRGYRDGFAGFVVASLGAFYVFLKYAKLWERKSLRKRGLDPDAIPAHHAEQLWDPAPISCAMEPIDEVGAE